MRRFAIAVLVLGGVLAAASLTSFARDPDWGGLGPVAVSPDGKTIVTGGQNRVLYAVNAQTFEVTRRVWVEARIGFLSYNKDGTRIVMEDEEENTEILDAATLQTVKRIGKAGFVDAARLADVMAATDDLSYKKQIRFFSMTDGSVLGTAACAEKVSCFGLNADATRLGVLTMSAPGKENKVEYKDVPKELSGLARKEFVQKNDGKTARLFVYEAPSGKVLKDVETWYSSDSSGMLFMDGETVYVVNYSNENLQVSTSNELKLFECQGSYNYGRGVSDDRKAILVGGLAQGSYTKVDGLSGLTFQIDRLRGWPEYFGGFAVHADGTGYGTTSSSRLIVISKEGKFLKSVPVY